MAGKRDVYVEATLEPDQYALIVEIDWKILTSEKVFSLTSYGSEDLDFQENFDIPISEILRSAQESIFTRYNDRKVLKTVKAMDNQVIDGVTKTYLCTDFGYDFFEYQNSNEKIKYFETFTFPKDQGLQIVAPDTGEKYDLELVKGQTKIVILRLTHNIYENSKGKTFNMVLGDDDLIQHCLASEDMIVRNEDGNIFIKTYQHETGMMLAYVNQSNHQVLEEQLKPSVKKDDEEAEGEKEDDQIKEVKEGEGKDGEGRAEGDKGVEGKGEGDGKGQPAGKGEGDTKKKKKQANQEDRSVQVKVGPGQMMIVKVNQIEDDWGFVTSLFY